MSRARAPELGLASLVHPAAGRRRPSPCGGALRPMPAGTLLGIPADRDPRWTVWSRVGGERRRTSGRAAAEPPARDVAVGALVRERFGDEVVDRLVDPLLGGVYAGRADRLSLAATVPGAAPRRRRPRHTLAARGPGRAGRGAAARPGRRSSPPCGVGWAGWSTRSPTRRPGAASVRTRADRCASSPAPGAGLAAGRWARPGTRSSCEADAVVLAVPAPPAARLLAGVAPGAAADWSGSSTTRAWPWSRWPCRAGTRLPELSGFLVPADRGLRGQGGHVLRHQVAAPARPDGRSSSGPRSGRYGEERGAAAHRRRPGRAGRGASWARCSARALPAAARPPGCTRWGGGLPQYARRPRRAGRAGPAPRCRPRPGRWPGRPTTGSASRPAYARGRPPPTPCWRDLGE